MSRPGLRFGVVADRPSSGTAWAGTARRIEGLGYDLLLTPDTFFTPSPFPALAAAAAATSRLLLGTWVVAAPFRTPEALERETSALQLLSDGRFELGIGTGRPDAERETRRLGGTWGSGPERLAQLVRAVEAVRAGVDPVPAVTVAAAGPRGLVEAGRIADTVALALPPTATVDAVRAAADAVHAHGEPALALQLAGVGGAWARWLARSAPTTAVAARAATFLQGDASSMAEQLLALVDATGVTVFPVAEEHAEAFAPVIALLR